MVTTVHIDFSHSQGQITLQSRVGSGRNIMTILVTAKNKEDPIKIEGDRVATTQNIDFSNTQGQITPQSEVGSGRNSNSSEMLWMSLLLLRIKKIRIKIKALEWSQH